MLVYIVTAAVGACFGLTAAVLFTRFWNYRGRRGAAIKKKKFEFSKLILLLVMATYFVGVGLGVKVTLMDYSQLGVLLTFIGAPTATSLAFYAWKARAENLIKIKQLHPTETEGTTIDLNNV